MLYKIELVSAVQWKPLFVHVILHERAEQPCPRLLGIVDSKALCSGEVGFGAPWRGQDTVAAAAPAPTALRWRRRRHVGSL